MTTHRVSSLLILEQSTPVYGLNLGVKHVIVNVTHENIVDALMRHGDGQEDDGEGD